MPDTASASTNDGTQPAKTSPEVAFKPTFGRLVVVDVDQIVRWILLREYTIGIVVREAVAEGVAQFLRAGVMTVAQRWWN